jgi:hypothetical protein
MNARTAREALAAIAGVRDKRLAFFLATRQQAYATAAMERRVRFGRLQRRSRA